MAKKLPSNSEESPARAMASSTGETRPQMVRAMIDHLLTEETEDEYLFIDGVREVVEAIDELSFDRENAAIAVELTERALAAIADIILGFLGFFNAAAELQDLIEELEDIHLSAARNLRLDPPAREALAERLFALQTGTDLTLFTDAHKTYRGMLGSAGERRYRELAFEAWEKIPPARTRGQRYDERTERLFSIMRTLANESGKVEDIALVRSKQLVSLEDYEQIVQLFRRAENLEEAVAWAERGRKAFPNLAAPALREFLVEAYEQLGMHDELLDLCIEEFHRYPNLHAYEHLRERGQRIGEWKKWRSALLEAARHPYERSRKRKRADASHDHSLVVEILLSEKEYDAAWQEAIAGDCSDELWLKLAAAREKSAPEDTRAVYESLVEQWIDSGARYQEAVDLLAAMAKLMRRERREEELQEYLEALRATHRRKRKLMELLDEAAI